MATIERGRAVRKRDRIALLILAGAVVSGAVLLVWSVWPSPQMGADEDVFRTVDALFTAVTARDEKLLGQCERQLRAHREAGKLPSKAAKYLDRIIAKARAGGWQVAAERLYAFMKEQRREGGPGQRAKPPQR